MHGSLRGRHENRRKPGIAIGNTTGRKKGAPVQGV